jgi:tryptophanyl-tRNA synthetase
MTHADHKTIDPYSSELPEDYMAIVRDFGLEAFDPSMFPDPNRIMRRKIVFAGRDLGRIAHAIKNALPFYVLSGIMPTNIRIHLGTKLVIENIRYFQEHGAHAFVLIADLEAAAARGVSIAEARERALSFHIPAYLALGLDPNKTTFYFQSENKEVVHLAYQFAQKVTLNEFRAIYGSADPGRIMSAVTQVGDILYPQLSVRMPGVIPVGIDQDPHIRLTRDVVARTKTTFKFIPPSGIYHEFTPSLDGEIKMSKSRPESCIELPEEIAVVTKKIKNAKTGGRTTLEEQKRIGAEPKKCMIYALYLHHLIEDDTELATRKADCESGAIMCGECKQDCVKRMSIFMTDFSKKLEENKRKVKDLKFIAFH